MIKLMSAAALIAASVIAAPASATPRSDYQAQMNRDPYYSQNRDYGDENPAFTLGCPRGSIPESYPNAIGRRCALPTGGYSY